MKVQIATLCRAFVLTSAFFGSSLEAQEVPEQAAIEARIEAEIRDKVEKPHLAAVADLQSKYSTALASEMAQLQKGGKLNESLAIKAEIDNLASGKGVPLTDEPVTPAELRKLRITYRATKLKLDLDRAKRIQPLTETLNRETGILAVKLTKDGRLTDAESAKRSAQLFAVKFSKLATISCGGTIEPLTDGSKAFANRNFVWEKIPTHLNGAKFVQNSGGSPTTREIRVKDAGAVYVAVDAAGITDHDALRKLGFAKLTTAFNYSDGAKTAMAIFGRFAERSIKLPEAGAWSGFVVIGDLR
jgi:hypothetical protein